MIVSNSAYNVGSLTNTFSIVRSGITITQAIPVGTYNTTTLFDQLNTIWNPLNIDFLYDPNTLQVTISDMLGTPFKIDKALSNMRPVLGFTEAFNFDSE